MNYLCRIVVCLRSFFLKKINKLLHGILSRNRDGRATGLKFLYLYLYLYVPTDFADVAEISYFDIRISDFGFGCGQRPRQEICGSNVFKRSELVKPDFPRAYL